MLLQSFDDSFFELKFNLNLTLILAEFAPLNLDLFREILLLCQVSILDFVYFYLMTVWDLAKFVLQSVILVLKPYVLVSQVFKLWLQMKVHLAIGLQLIL